jgi:hypothetical protein
MDSINTRRWPRYQVHLPVFIVGNSAAKNITVPGLVCELSCAGMELYGGVNLQPGDEMEVEFQTSVRLRVAGVVRNRSGFCFGLEFRSMWTKPEEPADVLESVFWLRHEAYLRKVQQNIDQSLRGLLEMRKCRKEIETFAGTFDEWLRLKQRYFSTTARTRSSQAYEE